MPHHADILTAIENYRLVELSGLFTRQDLYPSDALDENQETYLHIAARKFLQEGSPYGLDLIEYLLRKHIDPDAVNASGQTAFQVGDINAIVEYGCTPLQHAVRQDPELPILFDLLLRKGADLNKPGQDGSTPVSDAAFFCKPDVLEKLVALGANLYVSYPYPCRHNPLREALNSTSGSPDERSQCVQFLLDRYVGIALTFYEDKLDNINLKGKILLGAELPEFLLEHNPSVGSAIKTIIELKAAVTDGTVSPEQLKAIKLACCSIRNDLLTHGQSSQALPLIKLINQLDLTWPELKTTTIELPATASAAAIAAQSPPARKAPGSGGCAVM